MEGIKSLVEVSSKVGYIVVYCFHNSKHIITQAYVHTPGKISPESSTIFAADEYFNISMLGKGEIIVDLKREAVNYAALDHISRTLTTRGACVMYDNEGCILNVGNAYREVTSITHADVKKIDYLRGMFEYADEDAKQDEEVPPKQDDMSKAESILQEVINHPLEGSVGEVVARILKALSPEMVPLMTALEDICEKLKAKK